MAIHLPSNQYPYHHLPHSKFPGKGNTLSIYNLVHIWYKNRHVQPLFTILVDILNVAIINPTDTEELALPIEGKKKKLTRVHFEKFGKAIGPGKQTGKK